MAARKKVARKSAQKKSGEKIKPADTSMLTKNAKIHLDAYEEIEKNIRNAWKKLCQDYQKGDLKALEKDRNELMLYLGECNYMAREYERIAKSQKGKNR